MLFILILCELLEIFNTSGRTSAKPPKGPPSSVISCRLYCQDVSPDAVSDPRTRGLDELIREVGVTRRGLYLRMAE